MVNNDYNMLHNMSNYTKSDAMLFKKSILLEMSFCKFYVG